MFSRGVAALTTPRPSRGLLLLSCCGLLSTWGPMSSWDLLSWGFLLCCLLLRGPAAGTIIGCCTITGCCFVAIACCAGALP